MLVALLVGGGQPAWLLIAIASVGNLLGSTLNWLIGRGVERYRDRRRFPVGPRALDRARGWYRRYGRWSLLESWVPIIGDPITVAAGAMRERFATFLLLVSIAKVGRYLAVAGLAMHWL